MEAFIIIVILVIVILGSAIFMIMNSGEKTDQPKDHFDLIDEGVDGDDAPTVKELEYFCLKDEDNFVKVWPKTDSDFLAFSIAGITYRENISQYVGEFIGGLMPEPTNEYDKNAIKIVARDGHHVGYVPAVLTATVRAFRDLPCECYCYIGIHFDEDGATYYSRCYITRKS